MAAMDREALQAIVKENILTDSTGDRDICTIYRDKEKLDALVTYLAEPYRGKIDYVASPESLGFILGALIAEKLEVGFIPIRNGKIAVLTDDDSIKASYIDKRDHAKALQMRKSNFPKGSRVILVDDWVETAATLQACLTIIEEAQGIVVGVAAFGADYNKATGNMIDDGRLRSVIVNRK